MKMMFQCQKSNSPWFGLRLRLVFVLAFQLLQGDRIRGDQRTHRISPEPKLLIKFDINKNDIKKKNNNKKLFEKNHLSTTIICFEYHGKRTRTKGLTKVVSRVVFKKTKSEIRFLEALPSHEGSRVTLEKHKLPDEVSINKQ